MNVNTYIIDTDTKIVSIKCNTCEKIKKLKHFRKEFLIRTYECVSCSKKGKKNPFYGKHHTEKSKGKIGGAVVDYSGKNNPFYGKKHTDEIIEKLKRDGKCRHSGKNNPFYGKKHKKETLDRIVEKNKNFRKSNPKLLEKYGLKRIKKTKNELWKIFEEYTNSITNVDEIQNKYGNDFRTYKNWWIKLGLIEKEELKTLCFLKKINSNPSVPENKLFNLLCEKYGHDNVIHHFYLGGYYYDICVFKKLLIEYDGYYWHKVILNKNDKIKTKIAKKEGYSLYRVEEKSNRKTNLEYEIRIIEKLL